MPVFDERKDRIGTGGILEFGHAVGCSRGDRPLGVDEKLRESRRGFRSIKFAERHRDLLAYAGVRIVDHAGEVPNRRGIPGMTERDDGHPTLPGIGGLQALVGIVEIIVGSRKDQTWPTSTGTECSR